MSIFLQVKRTDSINELLPIPTSIPQIDALLNGGINRTQITELYGPAGSGKTQFALSVALNAVVSSAMNDHVLYISTEHCFPIKRLYQMIACLDSSNSQSYEAMASKQELITNNIHILNIADAHHQYTLIKYQLSNFLSTNPRISIIIVDSISGHYRGLEKGGLETGKEVFEMGAGLKRAASEFNCAVLVLNQVADVMQSIAGQNALRRVEEWDKGGFKAALGVGWEASVNTKIKVCRSRVEDGIQIRRLDVIYSASGREDGLEFYVDTSGIQIKASSS